MVRRGVIAVIAAVVVILLAGLGVGLYFVFRPDESPATVLSEGAVVTLAEECTDASVEILRRGGSAVDSAITAAFCQGLTFPHSSGIGGGVVATVYIKATGTMETINSREVAPLAAHKDMYESELPSREGGLAVAVPGELKGLYELHQRYGKLKWEEVVQPVIDIATNGFKFSNNLVTVLSSRVDKINARPLFR